MRLPQALLVTVIMVLMAFTPAPADTQSDERLPHLVQPGDTWSALSQQYGLSAAFLRESYGHINRMRQPTIGTTMLIPAQGESKTGILSRTYHGGLLQLSVLSRVSSWSLAMRNDLSHPYYPTLYGAIVLPGGDQPPRDLPPHFTTLEVNKLIAHPGELVAFRGESSHAAATSAKLAEIQLDIASEGRYVVGIAGTGAFYGSGEPELSIRVAGETLWSQPWRFEDREWDYQQITLTGSAAAIDQESIARERERLFGLWSQVSPEPLWNRSFIEPINDYLDISSTYGARRSYNGGPYRTYHEGVDFSAYGGTAVFATAGGVVILAEKLYVRGGAVIIDHGLGIYSGVYHLSEVKVSAGERVEQGAAIGAVGTTGLSTGNHLHWDMLVGSTWIDGAAWLEQGSGCWLLEGLGRTCATGG